MSDKSNPIPSAEEIEKYMDFDGLLQLHRTHQRKQLRTRLSWLVGSVLVIAVSLQLYVYFQPEAPASITEAPPQQAMSAVPDSLATDTSVSEKVQPRDETRATTHKTQKPKAKETPQELTTILQPVYIAAEPLDGFPQLYAFLEKELPYPESEKSSGIEGTVTITFEINLAGKAENLHIQNSLGPEFDAAIVRLMEKMPAWKPATLNGKPVTSKASLPLHFEIKR